MKRIILLWPFLLLFVTNTNCHKQLSSISVPTDSCTPEILKAVEEDLAKQRRNEGLPKLKISPNLMALAKIWAAARGEPTSHGKGFVRGEYATEHGEGRTPGKQLSLSSFDLFADWRASSMGQRPWYCDKTKKLRVFTEGEWAKTREYGIGCATGMTGKYGSNLWLVLHFRYPKNPPLSEIQVQPIKITNTYGCPAGLIETTIIGFNQRRKGAGLNPLIVTAEMIASAFKDASKHPVLIQKIANNPYNKIAGQYAVYKDVPITSKYIDLEGFDIYGGRLNFETRSPWYRGDTKYGRFFSADEWAKTTDVGVACSTYLIGNGVIRFLLMVHFKYPGVNNMVLRPCNSDFC